MKKTHHLKTKEGETITIVEGLSLDESIDFFAKIKNLPKEDLLEIYKIEEE